MRESLLDYLRCPACRAEELRLDVERTEGDEIEEGRIVCAGCGIGYPIVRGVPRMLPEAQRYLGGGEPGVEEDEDAKAMRLTVTQYSSYQGGVTLPFVGTRDDETNLEQRTGLSLSDFAGQVCLEAGCGNGRFTRAMAKAGAKAAIGFDAGFAVDEAHRLSKDFDNIHFLQGDILRPPFKEGCLDRAISLGVLHHTAEPDRSFRGLAPLVKEGGTFSIYLYGRPALDWRRYGRARSTFGQLRYFLYTEPLRRLIMRLPDAWRWRWCQLLWQRRRLVDWLATLGPVGRALSAIVYYLTPDGAHVPGDSPEANTVRIYDDYSTPYLYTHEVQEAMDWYEQSDFREILVQPYRVCITGWRGKRAEGEPLLAKYYGWKSFDEYALKPAPAAEPPQAESA